MPKKIRPALALTRSGQEVSSNAKCNPLCAAGAAARLRRLWRAIPQVRSDSLALLSALLQLRQFPPRGRIVPGGATMSLRAAINANCGSCSYDPKAPGTWREQVAQCPVIRCALWPVRPAPSGGPFANPPRDPASVTREWFARPVGLAISPHPLAEPGEGEAMTGGAP